MSSSAYKYPGISECNFIPNTPLPSSPRSLMVSQNPSPSSRHRRRSSARQPQPKAPRARKRPPADRVLCAHCGKKLSASTAYRHELDWSAATATSLAEANPLPHQYPLVSPPSSPWRAGPSSDDGHSVSPFHSSELSEEGLHRSDVHISSLNRVLGGTPDNGATDADIVGNIDDPDDNITHDFADDDGAHSGPGTMGDSDMQDVNMEAGDLDHGMEDQQEEGWGGIGDLDEADGFGVEGRISGDDFHYGDDGGDSLMRVEDGQEDENGGADGEEGDDGLNADGDTDDVDDNDYDPEGTGSGDTLTSSGTNTESSSDTDSDEFVVRRWSDEEDPPPQQHGYSADLPPLLPIGVNADVVLGRSRK